MLGDVRHARSEHESSPLSPCMYSPSRGLLLQQAPPTPERPAPRGRIPTPCSPADSGHAPDVLPLPTPVKWLPRGRSEAVGGANASEPPRERSFFPPANAGTPPISQPLPAPHPPQPPPFATRHPWGHILLSPPDSPRDACARPPFAWASGRPEPHLIGGGFSGVDSKNEGLPGAIGSGGCAAGGNGPEKRSYKPRWSPRDPRDGVVAGERRVAAEVDAGCSFAGVCGGPPPGDGAAGWFSRRGHVYGGPTPALSGLPRARPVPAAAARLIDVSRVLPAVLRSASPVPQQPPPGLRMRRAASLSQDTDDELPAAACDGLTEDEKEIARGQVAAYDRLAAAARPPAPHPAAALLLQQGQPRGLVYPQVQPTARVVPVEAPLVPVGTRVISQLAKLQNDVASILEFSNSLDAKIGSLGCEVRDSARNIDEQSLRLEAIASQTVTADTAKDERDSEMLEQLEARGSWGTLLRGAHEKAEQMARELDDLLRSDAERPRYRRASAPAGGLAAGGRPSGGVAPRSGSHGGEGGGAPPCRRKPLSGSPPATPAVLPEPATLPGWEQSPLMVLSPPCADEVVAAGNSEWSPITMASLSGGRRSRTSDAAHPAPRNERGQAPACTSPPASRGKQQPGRHTARHAFSRAKPQSPGEREPNFAKADCSPLKDALDTLPPCSSPPGPRGKQQPGRHTARHAAGHAFSCAKPQSPGEREPNFEKADCSPLKDAFDTCSSSRVSSLAALVATGGSSHEAPHAADAGTRKTSRSWTHDHQPAPPHLPARPGGGAAAHAVDGSGDTAPRMTGPASADDGTLSDDRHGLTSSEPDTFPAARSVTQSPCAGACSADSECSDAPASGRPRPETRSQFQHAAPGLSAGGGWGPSQASTIAVYPRGFRDCESGCSVLAGEGMTPSQTSTTVYPRGFRDRERECSVLADDGRAHSQATVYPRGFPGRENESGVPGSWAVRGTEDTSPHYRRGTDGASGACGQRARSESEARSLAARDILSSLAGRPAGDADQGSSPGLAVESFPRPDRGSVPRAAGAGAQAASRRRGGGVAVKPARPALDQVRGVSPERFAPREDRPASPGCGGGGGGAVAGHNHVERASTRPTGGPTAGLTSSWGGQVRRASPGGAEPSKAEKSRCTVAPQPDLSRGCSPHSFSSWAEHPRASSTEQVHRVSGGTEPSKVETSRQTIAQQPDLSRGCSPLSFSSWAEHPSACSIEQAHRASSGSTQPSKADTARQIVAPQSDLSPCNYSSRAEHPNTCSIEQVHRASGSTQPSKADTARQIVAPQSDLSPCNYSSRAEHPSTCSIEQVHRASGSTQPSIAEPSCQTVARLPDPSRGCSPRNFSSWGEHPSTSSIEQVHRSTEPSKAETSRQTVAQRPDQSRGCSQRKFVSCGGQSRTCSTEQLHRAASCCGTEPSCVPRGCAPESLGSSGGQSRTCRGSRNVGGTGAGGREAGTDDPSCENHAGEEQTRAGSSARVPSSSRCSTEELHRTGVVSSARDLPGRKQANGHASIKPRAPSPLQKSAQRSEGSHAEAIRAVSPSTRSRMTGPTGSGASIARAADSVRPRTPPSPHEGAHRSDSRLSPAKHANRAGAIQADSPAGHSHRRPSVSNASIVCAVDTIQPRTPSPLHKGAQRSDSRLSQAKHVERADAVQASSPAGRSHRGPPGSNVSNAPIACAVDTIQPRTLSPLHKGAQQSDSRLFQAKHEVKRAAAIQASSPAGKSHKAPPGSNAPNASIACAVDVGSLSGHDGARYELACDGCDEEGPATRPAAPSLELSERAWAAVEDKGGVDPVSCFGQRRHAVRTDRPPHAPSDIRADSASSSAERVGAERRLAIAASLAADGRPHGGSPSTARSVLRPRDPNVEILPAASKPGRAAGAADKGKASPLGELHSSPRSFLSGRSTSLLRSLAPSAHKQEVQLEAIVTSRQLKYESACRALMSGDNEAARTLLLQCASDGQVMTNSLKACFAAQME
ncbi:hypothetical protein DIPPA_25974 [Diplonema papillatum]|nr:hypothetical protein DIPPA_25974 [Diplonema papillatum]